MRTFLRFFLLIVLISAPRVLGAYSSVTVPVEEPVYRQLDKLVAHGLVKTRLLGQRPYVRSEIARLIAEALRNYPDFEARYRDASIGTRETAKRLRAKVYIDGILDELKYEYADELAQLDPGSKKIPRFQGQPFDQLRFDYIYLDQTPMLFPPNNGLGGINAVTRPLVEQRGGRHYQNGSNFAFESTHWMRLGKYFSVQAEPRFQIQVARDQNDETKAFVQRLNGRLTWRALDLEIGRDSLNWGPSPDGGLGISNNARPLDFIKLSSIHPFEYPFFFRKLGINEWSLVVANLGPEQHFKNSWLVAWKMSNRGSPYFEMGFSQLLVMGGEGAPSQGFGDSILQFFGVGGKKEASNRSLDVDLIATIPQWRGLEIYNQLSFEDFDINPSVFFGQDINLLSGLYLPRLNDSGTLDLRLEFRRLTPSYARHPVFTDGMTENQFLLGDPLGPGAYALSAEVKYDLTPKTLLALKFRFAQRSGDIYEVDDDTDSVEKILSRPKETRYLGMFALRRRLNRHFTLRAGLGVEGVRNVNFQEGDKQTQWLGEFGFTYHFRPHFSVHRKED
ncbi:MAG TPA: hypothetical protein DF383_07055 [Deltaproteobacteria bacterium]|nr:hypothetical protein [Deltaproteobacteria bacterium]